MIVDNLLSRLEKVKRTSPTSWRACCPGHQGTNPTALSITEAEDGKVMLHCFRGCSPDEIVSAVGLTLSDLFPPDDKIGTHDRPRKLPFNPLDVLASTSNEAMLVSLCAIDVANGKTLTDDQRSRLLLAANRLRTAAETCHAL